MQKFATWFMDILTGKPSVMRWFAEHYPHERLILDASATFHRSYLHDWYFDRYLHLLLGSVAVFIVTPERIIIRSEVRPFLYNLLASALVLWAAFPIMRLPDSLLPLAILMILFYLFRARPRTIRLLADQVDHISVPHSWQNSIDKWNGFRLHTVDGRIFRIYPSWPDDIVLLDRFSIVRE